MILYVLKKNKNSKSAAFGKYFAYPVIEETVTLDGLAEHMSSHNTPYSKGAIKGMLTDMVSCIKELLLEGKNVKIADLAIFSLGIKNSKGGAVSEDVFTVSKHIKGVKLRARATGELIAKSLNLEATLKKASATSKTSGNGGTTGGGNNGGSDNQGGTGSITGGSSSGGSSTGGSNTGGNSGSGSGSSTSGSQGSDSGTPGNYRLVIYKYGSGTSTVTDDSEQEFANDSSVASGSNVNICVVPAEGKVPTAKVNGNSITLTENDGTYTGSFVMPTKGTVLEINSEPSDIDWGDDH